MDEKEIDQIAEILLNFMEKNKVRLNATDCKEPWGYINKKERFMPENNPLKIHIYAPEPEMIISNTDQTEKYNYCMCCNKTRLMANTERWIYGWFEQEQHCIQGKGCRKKER